MLMARDLHSSCAVKVRARVVGCQSTYELILFCPVGEMKWPKSEEFSEIHGVFTPKVVVQNALLMRRRRF